MAAVTTWGLVQLRERNAPMLGGREPWVPPAWAASDYATMCRETKACVRSFGEIRWYTINADTLPSITCPLAGEALVGCYEPTTGALTIVAGWTQDSVLIRHEMQHAALERFPMTHPCKWFHPRRATLVPGTMCEGPDE